MSNFFTEVIQKDPRFLSTSRVSDLQLLEPVTREQVKHILAHASEHGIDLMVFETFRSQKRQEELFRNGASKLRKVGVHHYGLACDIVKKVNGEPSWKGDFTFMGQLARLHGLIWGGDWGNPNIPHDFVDSVHVQRCALSDQTKLFSNDWYPEDTYNPYGEEEPDEVLMYQLTMPMMVSKKIGVIQRALTQAGFDTKGIDNVFGKDTRAAVLAFQQARHLKMSGGVGKETAEALGIQL